VPVLSFARIILSSILIYDCLVNVRIDPATENHTCFVPFRISGVWGVQWICVMVDWLFRGSDWKKGNVLVFAGTRETNLSFFLIERWCFFWLRNHDSRGSCCYSHDGNISPSRTNTVRNMVVSFWMNFRRQIEKWGGGGLGCTDNSTQKL
jgi:hypothetical protein